MTLKLPEDRKYIFFKFEILSSHRFKQYLWGPVSSVSRASNLGWKGRDFVWKLLVLACEKVWCLVTEGFVVYFSLYWLKIKRIELGLVGLVSG